MDVPEKASALPFSCRLYPFFSSIHFPGPLPCTLSPSPLPFYLSPLSVTFWMYRFSQHYSVQVYFALAIMFESGINVSEVWKIYWFGGVFICLPKRILMQSISYAGSLMIEAWWRMGGGYVRGCNRSQNGLPNAGWRTGFPGIPVACRYLLHYPWPEPNKPFENTFHIVLPIGVVPVVYVPLKLCHPICHFLVFM